MKIRTGFVSNSSSSSFTCDISGTHSTNDSGSWDNGVILECENSHYFTFDYFISKVRGSSDKEILADIQSLFWVSEFSAEELNDKLDCDLFNDDDIELLSSIDKNKKALIKLYSKLSNKNITDMYKIVTNDGGDDIAYDDIIIPEFRCPICSFKKIEKETIIQFMVTKLYGKDKTIKDAEMDILSSFKDRGSLNRFIK